MQLSKKESRILEFIILVLLLIGGYVFRFVDVFKALWADSIDQSFFEIVRVTEQEFVYTSSDFVTKAYVYMLHFICMVFGNDYFLCSLVHFVLFALAMLIFYFAFKKIIGIVISMLLFAFAMLLPYSIKVSISCNPVALLLLIGSILVYIIVSCIKTIIKITKYKDSKSNTGEEPVVTVVNFDEEKAVSIPAHEEEKPAIFIPKSMEIPKRQAKPKLDYSLEVSKDAMFYDMDVAELDNFDLPNPF